MVSGTNNGDVSGLNTTATNLVGAINEVHTLAAGGGVQINDGATNTTDAWSGSKVNTEIVAQVAAALEGEDLSELAAAVAANAAADLDFVTLAAFTSLQTLVNTKAAASDVYTQAELGDPDTDLAAIWAAA